MDNEDERTKRFSNAINRHGYPFQNAVVRTLAELFDARKSEWLLEATEFPILVGSRDAKIDFILRANDKPFLLVAECKRTNPAFSDWLFARSSFVAPNHSEKMLADSAFYECDGSVRAATIVLKHYEENAPVCHIAIDVKTGAKGDAVGDTGTAIEDAATQISRGANGLIAHLEHRPHLLPTAARQAIVIPLIFTTAKLYLTDTDLASADLTTGRLDLTSESVKEVPYVFYQHHTSVSIKHTLRGGVGGNMSTSFANELRDTFIRTIPVVGASHIPEFIRGFHPETLDIEKLTPR